MEFKNPYPLCDYEELEPLCERGHVLLVRSRRDGQLYVKKRVQCYAPGLYGQLREKPVKNTPILYGIYEDTASKPEAPGAVPLILIEEYLPGHTLAELLQDDRVFTERDCARIAQQLCRILMDLHSRSILHRDIKPANVIIQPDGTVKLLDFSAAKIEDARQRRDTMLIGTVGFAAPEQYGFSASTPQTDLYALGVLMNMLLTGALPGERKAYGRLRPVIDRCLQMDPKNRYAGAWELHDALKQVCIQRLPSMPPGFRTLRWYKMIPAALGYGLMLFLGFASGLEYLDDPMMRVALFLTFSMPGILMVLFYANYLDIRRYFPLMRCRSRWLRILGMVIAPVLIVLLTVGFAGAIVVSAAVIAAIFLQG